MKDFIKGLIVMAVLVYIVSPIDAVPGPIDDIVVIMLGLASRKKIEDRN